MNRSYNDAPVMNIHNAGKGMLAEKKLRDDQELL
jgi:hypothetical protein